jgi:cell division protein FtsL
MIGMLRILHMCVILALVVAAADVYRIKFESTRKAQQVAKLRLDITRERDAVAALRAEWSKLDTPTRIQDLARRHLALQQIETRQYDTLDHLPDRAPDLVPPDAADPIGNLLQGSDPPTASISRGPSR